MILSFRKHFLIRKREKFYTPHNNKEVLMNPKLKLFLTGIGLFGATTLFGIYWFWDVVIYLFPSAPKYIFLSALAIGTVLLLPVAYYFGIAANWAWEEWLSEYFVGPTEAFIKVARTKWYQTIRLTPKQRSHHVHVIGSTGVGKTELLLNMMSQDIEQGRGLLLIEHKSDPDLLNQIYAQVIKEGRKRLFRLFSLGHPKKSSTYNPLIGDNPHEIAERIFNSFEISHEFYSKVQFQWLSILIELLMTIGEVVTFKKLYESLIDDTKVGCYLKRLEEKEGISSLSLSVTNYLSQDKKYREQNLKGLEVNLMPFAIYKELDELFNVENPQINMDTVLDWQEVVYFQLPTMSHYQTARAIGRLVLQDFQSAISRRLTQSKKEELFSCYLDEFASLAYPGFTELISKSRAANIGLVLSHQTISDLENVSKEFSGMVLSNTNTKVVFRCPHPQTAEYFANTFGTKTVKYQTTQMQGGLLGTQQTGSGSEREVESYIVHPNKIKNFRVGHGVISTPKESGISVEECEFFRVKRLPVVEIPDRANDEDIDERRIIMSIGTPSGRKIIRCFAPKIEKLKPELPPDRPIDQQEER